MTGELMSYQMNVDVKMPRIFGFLSGALVNMFSDVSCTLVI